MSEAHAALHAIVHGRVQGVGFRFFVQRRAGEKGLSGWVRNLPDGAAVEVLAEGPRSTLEALVSDLHRGPRMALVEKVDVSWREAAGAFEGFGIRV